MEPNTNLGRGLETAARLPLQGYIMLLCRRACHLVAFIPTQEGKLQLERSVCAVTKARACLYHLLVKTTDGFEPKLCKVHL